MRLCPTCWEDFEDDLSYCMFDGTALRPADRSAGTEPQPLPSYHSDLYSRAPRAKGRKLLVFALLMVASIGGALAVYSSRKPEDRPAATPNAMPAAVETVKAAGVREPETPSVEEPKPPASIAEITRSQLMELLPGDVLGRFQGGRPDLRIVADDKHEYVVMAGIGRSRDAGRISALRYESGQFLDATRRLLPGAYSSGAVKRQAEVRFDEANVNILVREPVSSRAIVDECDACDHAYQQVTLSWKNGRYAERSRLWSNDRYTVFYAVADALEKRLVDARARSVIDGSLDARIARGFARNDDKGWIVLWRNSASDTIEYELKNGSGYLVITVSKIKDRWKAIAISGD
ncbi:MAG: hypothetical protein L0229_02475 [Blastocatellia bacterium]|nr:hypothetical protein [Blastocatellia bacterium]